MPRPPTASALPRRRFEGRHAAFGRTTLCDVNSGGLHFVRSRRWTRPSGGEPSTAAFRPTLTSRCASASSRSLLSRSRASLSRRSRAAWSATLASTKARSSAESHSGRARARAANASRSASVLASSLSLASGVAASAHSAARSASRSSDALVRPAPRSSQACSRGQRVSSASCAISAVSCRPGLARNRRSSPRDEAEPVRPPRRQRCTSGQRPSGELRAAARSAGSCRRCRPAAPGGSNTAAHLASFGSSPSTLSEHVLGRVGQRAVDPAHAGVGASRRRRCSARRSPRLGQRQLNRARSPGRSPTSRSTASAKRPRAGSSRYSGQPQRLGDDPRAAPSSLMRRSWYFDALSGASSRSEAGRGTGSTGCSSRAASSARPSRPRRRLGEAEQQLDEGAGAAPWASASTAPRTGPPPAACACAGSAGSAVADGIADLRRIPGAHPVGQRAPVRRSRRRPSAPPR